MCEAVIDYPKCYLTNYCNGRSGHLQSRRTCSFNYL